MKKSSSSRWLTSAVLAALLLALSVGLLPGTLNAEESGPALSKPFSLAEAALGDESVSGLWHYALRQDDGYAVALRYTGAQRDVSLPVTLDGHPVVGVADGALTDAASVTIHSQILWMGEAALPQAATIRAKNGSYALWYASAHA